ncbi:MAG: hypothetical protein JWP87_1042 [Labilithrix sp.]|nr:hypothetical protein [Labilithrix sp.]
MRRSRLMFALAIASALVAPSVAHAQEPSPTAPPPAPAPPIAASQIDLEKDTQSSALVDAPAPPPEAPPPPPYKKSIVVDSSLGALVFLGKFGKTAPPAPWIRTQVGYELFKWLMLFGEGELGFTDTSGSQEPPKTRAFPLFGFGGGARFTVRFTDRFGVYAQGSLGAMKADIRRRALEIIGFKDAEDLGLYLGGRLGLEWYQLDRHFALGVTAGLRDATGFKRTLNGGGGSDTPLVFDTGAAIRYAF